MKSCPKCKSVFFDETLEFCMEDGSPLILTSPEKDEIPTLVKNNANFVAADKNQTVISYLNVIGSI